MRPISTAAELIANRYVVDAATGCWNWTGYKDRKGYGRATLGGRSGRSTGAHRLALIAIGKSLADADLVLHHCDNPACINPAHLFVGTQADNMRDMHAKGRAVSNRGRTFKKPEHSILRGEAHPNFGARQSVCQRGHPQTGENVVVRPDGHRRCRVCHRERSLRTYHRLKSKGEE